MLKLREVPVQLDMQETVGAGQRTAEAHDDSKVETWSSVMVLLAARIRQFAYGFADQTLAVGGTFLVNVVLARTQSKEEYGMFALSYSVFTFLSGLYNAAILEPYTIYGAGRYRDHFAEYLRLMVRSNFVVSALLSSLLLLVAGVLWWSTPHLAFRALLGLALTIGLLLSGAFLRRVFYVRRQPFDAARISFTCLVAVAAGIWIAIRAQIFNSFSAFLILGLGWLTAAAFSVRRLPLGDLRSRFLEREPQYWKEHWKYARWVLATAFVFQLTSQGYYWLVAALLSVKEVAELKAVYVLVAPIDQIFIALSFLFLPALSLHHATGDTKRFLSLHKQYALGILATSAIFALAVRIVGTPLMHFLYAGKFDDLSPLLYILAFLPMIMGFGDTMNNALKAGERPRFVFYAYVCSGAVTFLAGIPLVAHLGVRGAVYGLLLSGGSYMIALAVGFSSMLARMGRQLRTS